MSDERLLSDEELAYFRIVMEEGVYAYYPRFLPLLDHISALSERLAAAEREREALGELAKILASALHHQNIGRDIRGWHDVSEAFEQVKAMLNGTWFGPNDRLALRSRVSSLEGRGVVSKRWQTVVSD